MNILVIAEHNNDELKAETLKVVNAALQLGNNVDVLIAGNECAHLAEKASIINGVNKVLIANTLALAHQLAEPLTEVIMSIASQYSHILSAAQTVGKSVMPRVAALLDVNQVSDIIKIEENDTFLRPIYAGNAIATVKSLDTKKIITVRTSAFNSAEITTNQAEIVDITAAISPLISEGNSTLSRHVSYKITTSKRPDLSSAGVVVSGGRGLQSKDNFKLLEKLADKMDGAVGASRAAVDAGFVSNDLQVGQTGKIVAPELYMAVGISGAIQHLAGMKDSKVVVAINKDADAPIFSIADYGLVADLFEVIPELTEKL